MPEAHPVELDAIRIIRTLNAHGVRYVVIGGFGSVLYGSTLATFDIDVTPATDDDNLGRLAEALKELGAGLRVSGQPDPVPMPLDNRSFASFTTMTLRTTAGDLDICLRPDASGRTSFDYDTLAQHAVVIELPEPVPVASLDDIIASKEASGREKDLLRLPELYSLRDRLREQ